MNNKRHKESNTFKFQNFAERIANINIDVFHRVGHEYETQQDDSKCCFYQAIEKWDVLDLTEPYNAFRKEINANNIVTLPQLLHDKERVVRVLLKHLRLKNPLCLQSILDLVVAFVNDLRKEFYPYYLDFLNVIIELLHTKDTDQLEWTFTCLAYLFKFLWRPLTKDINVVFVKLLPLLSDSKPYYINNFAAESFAFVVRKIKDHQSFLKLILTSVKNTRDGIGGCGKLLFHVVLGVNGQFHSCADIFLPFLLKSLTDPKLPQPILFSVLEEIIVHIASHIHPAKSELFWTTSLDLVEDLQEKSNIPVLESILKLLGEAIEHRNGKLVTKPALIVQVIAKLSCIEGLPETTLLLVAQIAVLLLLSKHIQLPQAQAGLLVRKLTSVSNTNVLLYFIEHAIDYSSFEAVILPAFLGYCIKSKLDTESLEVLTKVVLHKAPPCNSGVDLEQWGCYSLNFGTKANRECISSTIMGHIRFRSIDSVIADPKHYVCALTCLPHVNSTENLSELLKHNLKLFCASIDEETVTSKCEERVQKLLWLLLCTLECAVHVVPAGDLLELLGMLTGIVLPLCVNPKFVCGLRVIDLYLTFMKEDERVNAPEVLKELNGTLEVNFSSPYHEVRLYTAHIYTIFEANLHPDWKVFSLCYTIESTSPQIATYRDQLQKLERLAHDTQQTNLCKDTEFEKIPLRFLCGTLYQNFKLLWDPVIALIVTHAQGLSLNDFWEVYVEELKTVVTRIRLGVPESTSGENDEHKTFLMQLFESVSQVSTKIDYVNYRMLLWKALSYFPEVAEAKTRDVSELFLKFIEEEYAKSNSELAVTWNVKQNSEVEEPTQQEDEDAPGGGKDARKPRGRGLLKTLQHHLTVFTKMRSPKSMYREPELYKLYYDFLSNKQTEVQKLAFDCLRTYKFKYLTPYEEHLTNLINDKHFKDELIYFNLDKDSSNIQQEHREQLLPVVLKIAYTKMAVKTGMRTGGKSSGGQSRRHLVLRFLAGCHEKEMLSFIQMALRFYECFFHDNPETMVVETMETVNLERFIPPKRLQSSLNLLTIVLEHFGGLMSDDVLRFVLKNLLVIGALIAGVHGRTELHSGYSAVFKNLRTSVVSLIGRFYEHFDRYPWSLEETNAVFHAFVWPYLQKLSVEGIHSPTVLLKLFMQWGSNPRYFGLLVKAREEEGTRGMACGKCKAQTQAQVDAEDRRKPRLQAQASSETEPQAQDLLETDVCVCIHEQYHREDSSSSDHILPHIMHLLLNPRTNPSVLNAILEMLEKLLSLIPSEEDLELKLPCGATIPVSQETLQRLNLNENLNYGSCILLPHIPAILETIRRKLDTKLKSLPHKELFVLSRISELVWEGSSCDHVLQLLLPVALKKSRSNEDTVLKLVTTIAHLLKRVDNREAHLRQLAAFFGEVPHASCRKILCEILQGVEHQGELAKMVVELNAWDAKWIDQPDFQRRLDGFKSIASRLPDKLDVLSGIFVIYNCYHMIRSETDLSLRENASDCWKDVACALVNSCPSTELDYFLNQVVFPIIRKGIKKGNDDVRSECILLLGRLSRDCPDAHPIFTDLNKVTNKLDPEVDFFENVVHLQAHRQVRALLKFCQVFKNEREPPTTRTLTQFVLPMVTWYLCTDKYMGMNSLIDAVIEVVGTVSRLLPWHQYEGMLKFYLGKLRQKLQYQKQLVKLLVAILDGYHFDLSKGSGSGGSKNKERSTDEVPGEDGEVPRKTGDGGEVPGDDGKVPGCNEEVSEDAPGNSNEVPDGSGATSRIRNTSSGGTTSTHLMSGGVLKMADPRKKLGTTLSGTQNRKIHLGPVAAGTHTSLLEPTTGSPSDTQLRHSHLEEPAFEQTVEEQVGGEDETDDVTPSEHQDDITPSEDQDDVTSSEHQDNVMENQGDDIDEAFDDIQANLEAEEEEGDDVTRTQNGRDDTAQIDGDVTEDDVKAVDRIKILSPSLATKVIRNIQTVLLPQLQKSLAAMTQHESSHKLNRWKHGFEREEEELLRVPISLALVKLLQRLPKEMLEANLPGIFLKACTFLRSQLESVRRVAREILQKIMSTLGPAYLNLLLEQMTTLLTRGYQVHVLVYTAHAILVHLKPAYKPGDVDKILKSVLEMCMLDLFGVLADEKEVEKIGRKVSEAKSTKSFDTLQILAQYISEKCLMDVLLPIRGVLHRTHQFKPLLNAQESLRHIALGLVENEFVGIESLLKFAYGTSSESIPALLPDKKKQSIEKGKTLLLSQKADSFIIQPPVVGRSGFRQKNSKSSDKANAHLLVEFGLRLCNHMFKKEKFSEDEYRPFIDPFVVIFKNCLSSKHVKLSTLTLQCLARLMKLELPSLKEHIAEITEQIFGILHKYAAAGLSKGDNFQLVVAAFKTMSVIVRDVKFHVISEEQLKTLLLYAEQDLHNYERQVTAFGLLRAITSRKLTCKEIHQVMEKVAELSVTSEIPHVRTQARLVFYNFVMDYPIKSRLTGHIGFYLSQLEYPLQTGRESALEMIQSLILAFPDKVLQQHSATFLMSLGVRLVNEEVPSCRVTVGSCLTAMFKRLPKKKVDPLYEMIVIWLKDRNKTHRQMAAQLCGILISVEKSSFQSRLPTLIPVILNQFGLDEESRKPGAFVRLKRQDDETDGPRERIRDHHLFQVMQLLLKICARCPSFLTPTAELQLLAEHTQTLLAHGHEWVRLGAAQFLGFILSSLEFERLSELLKSGGSEEVGYLYTDPEGGLKSLTLDLCAQLQPGSIKSELAEQVVKNLVFVARVLENVPFSKSTNDEGDTPKLDLFWLTKRMRRIVNTEVVQTPTSTTLRFEVFKWIAGVVTALSQEKVVAVLNHLLAPLVREMITTEETNSSLRHFSKEVAKLIKQRIGLELYTATLNKLQQHLAVKRTQRKRDRTQLAVTDPEMYAKRKIKHNEKKKVAKKRKIEKKGKTRFNKKRKVQVDDFVSEMI